MLKFELRNENAEFPARDRKPPDELIDEDLSLTPTLESLTAKIPGAILQNDSAHWPGRRVDKPGESSLGKAKI